MLLSDFLSFLADALGFWPPRPSFVLSGRWGNNTEAAETDRYERFLRKEVK